MADIFISWAREDKNKVKPLAKALEDQGWSVWWDDTIPVGKSWTKVIEEEMDAAKCMVIIWSNKSVSSDWVQAEAEEGLRREILVPVLFEDVNIPLRFRRIQTANLVKWQGDSNDPKLQNLISDLSSILGPPPSKTNVSEQILTEAEGRHMVGRVFVSYSHEDQKFALQLAKNLKNRGVPVWLDQWDVPPGADWDQTIDEALYECAQMLIVLSPASIKSREVRGELRIALDEDKPIVPVLFKKCPIPRQLRVVNYVDFTSIKANNTAALERILGVLKMHEF